MDDLTATSGLSAPDGTRHEMNVAELWANLAMRKKARSLFHTTPETSADGIRQDCNHYLIANVLEVRLIAVYTCSTRTWLHHGSFWERPEARFPGVSESMNQCYDLY